MLERARSIARDYNGLQKELAENYNISTAKKLGELSNTTEILQQWERARSVSDGLIHFFFCQV
jgi:hypothetical protein